MKIICVAKFVPDVDSFNYDFENNTLLREQIRQILNPDDACAIGCALEIKKRHPDTEIEVLTMAPMAITPYLEDLIRMGVDQCVLLSDKKFSGSDTYATSLILAKQLSQSRFDVIFTGTHAIDGDTSHVPPQMAERLALAQLSGISRLNMDTFSDERCVVQVEDEQTVRSFEVKWPAVLSLTRESAYKLPYVKRQDMYKDVKAFIQVLNHEDLGLKESEIGLAGSLTRVVKTYTKNYEKRDKKVVQVDEAGVEVVFNFLKDKGILK